MLELKSQIDEIQNFNNKCCCSTLFDISTFRIEISRTQFSSQNIIKKSQLYKH